MPCQSEPLHPFPNCKVKSMFSLSLFLIKATSMRVERHGLQRDVSRSSRIARFILSKGLQLPGWNHCKQYVWRQANTSNRPTSSACFCTLGRAKFWWPQQEKFTSIHDSGVAPPTGLCHVFRCANVCICPGNQFLAAPPHLIANSASAWAGTKNGRVELDQLFQAKLKHQSMEQHNQHLRTSKESGSPTCHF